MTATDAGVMSWTAAGTGGVGDITAIGDVASGDGFTAAGTQGTSLYFYDAQGRGQLTIADLSTPRTYTLPDASGTFAFGTGSTGHVPYWSDTNTLAYDTDGDFFWDG